MNAYLVAPFMAALICSSGFAQEDQLATAPVTQPVQFAEMARMSNLFDIETSKVALEKATSPEVRAYAKQMIDDHMRASELMQPASESEGIDLPTELDEQHRVQLEAIAKSQGQDFDKVYLSAQLEAHEQAVALFEGYASKGTPGALKDFAAKTLPTLQEHLQDVKVLSAK
jgi:putative membrane protein